MGKCNFFKNIREEIGAAKKCLASNGHKKRAAFCVKNGS